MSGTTDDVRCVARFSGRICNRFEWDTAHDGCDGGHPFQPGTPAREPVACTANEGTICKLCHEHESICCCDPMRAVLTELLRLYDVVGSTGSQEYAKSAQYESDVDAAIAAARALLGGDK